MLLELKPLPRVTHLVSGARRQPPFKVTSGKGADPTRCGFGAEGQGSHLYSPSVEGHLALEDFRAKKWWSRGELNSCWSGENRVS